MAEFKVLTRNLTGESKENKDTISDRLVGVETQIPTGHVEYKSEALPLELMFTPVHESEIHNVPKHRHKATAQVSKNIKQQNTFCTSPRS
jgi:hypothetical protein